jgi:hypothetical protein
MVIDLRKQKEKEFHDRLRSVTLKEEPLNYSYLTANKKFYSITRQSYNFITGLC